MAMGVGAINYQSLRIPATPNAPSLVSYPGLSVCSVQ